MTLALKNIRLPLADFALEIDATFTCPVTAICGPSGAGKTSLLDLIAGLRRPERALIKLDDQILTDTSAGVTVPANLRRIGYVPQDLALFPHLSVRKNLLYGVKQPTPGDSMFQFDHVASVLELKPFAERGISDLSGGAKQRVALGRALLWSPARLLVDETRAGRDAALKAKIMPYLARVRTEFQVPMLYVSHNRAEVEALCDEVIEMERGRVVGRD